MKTLFSAADISARIHGMAAEIAAALPAEVADEGLVMVGPLKGCVMFAADLSRALYGHNVPLEFDFLGLSSYGAGTVSSGTVTIDHDTRHPLVGRHVLLIDDIIDTGRTLDFAIQHINAKEPRSLSVATLLDKPSRRVTEVSVDHVGFKIEDVFVVGYGTDYAERYREMPFIGILRD